MGINRQEQLEDVKREDFIWAIYVFIAFAALLSNRIEKEFITTGSRKRYREFHEINTVLFTIAFLIYCYFVIRSFNKFNKKHDLDTLWNLIASILFLVGGGIFLYLELMGNDENNELGI